MEPDSTVIRYLSVVSTLALWALGFVWLAIVVNGALAYNDDPPLRPFDCLNEDPYRVTPACASDLPAVRTRE